jgi:hypothetical protein
MLRRALIVSTLTILTPAYALAQNDATPSKPVPAPAPIFTNAPTPAPKLPAKKPFLINGDLRAYDLFRTNGEQNASNPNREAFNFGGSLHVEYHVPSSNFYLGTTYSGAYPFGLTGKDPAANTHVDNTLPGFPLSTFDEAYAGYSNAYTQVKVGDQIINTPFANAADSRIMPAAFQGASAAVRLAPGWTLLFDDMDRFESRTSSGFGRYTLLTAPVPGASNSLAPSTTEKDTSGFVMPALQYQGARFGIAAFDYSFSSIANLFYTQAQFNLDPHIAANPFVGAQYATESNASQSTIGKIENSTMGVQFGATLAKNLVFTASGDYAPWNNETVTLAKCSAANEATTGIFLPSGGTPDCVAHANGTATIYYGGIASPYTDSYAADPLYTTALTQGMADRRSAGVSEKLAATYQPLNKQLRVIVATSWFNYINPAGPNLTKEFDADATYFLNKVKPGRYHGLSVRYRYGDRTQPTLPYDFKYNRAQLEYDF